jgi:hypothetical protein
MPAGGSCSAGMFPRCGAAQPRFLVAAALAPAFKRSRRGHVRLRAGLGTCGRAFCSGGARWRVETLLSQPERPSPYLFPLHLALLLPSYASGRPPPDFSVPSNSRRCLAAHDADAALPSYFPPFRAASQSARAPALDISNRALFPYILNRTRSRKRRARRSLGGDHHAREPAESPTRRIFKVRRGRGGGATSFYESMTYIESMYSFLQAKHN